MLKNFIIKDLAALEEIRAWVMVPNNRSTLIHSSGTYSVVVDDAPGLEPVSQRFALEFAAKVEAAEFPR